jgi:error-prone DNA polymerase
MWQAVGSVLDKGLLRSAVIVEDELQWAPPSEAENIVADYRHLGLTLGRHPLSLLRERLSKVRFIAAADLSTFSNGQLARSCGIVTGRQRPGTANGGCVRNA